MAVGLPHLLALKFTTLQRALGRSREVCQRRGICTPLHCRPTEPCWWPADLRAFPIVTGLAAPLLPLLKFTIQQQARGPAPVVCRRRAETSPRRCCQTAPCWWPAEESLVLLSIPSLIPPRCIIRR